VNLPRTSTAQWAFLRLRSEQVTPDGETLTLRWVAEATADSLAVCLVTLHDTGVVWVLWDRATKYLYIQSGFGATRRKGLSLSATQQAAQFLAVRKIHLEGWNSTHGRYVYVWEAGSTTLCGAEEVRWLRSPPHSRRTSSLLECLIEECCINTSLAAVTSLWVDPPQHAPPAAGGVPTTNSSSSPVA
jgi:hypothetical protein